jgi:hypothetical protein
VVGRLAMRDGCGVAFRQAGSPPSETARMAILRKRSLACSTSLSGIRGGGNFVRMGKMTLIRPADMADEGTMNVWGPRILTFSLTIGSKVRCLRNRETVCTLLDLIANHSARSPFFVASSAAGGGILCGWRRL